MKNVMEPCVQKKISLNADVIIDYSKKMKGKSGIGNMV